MSALQNLPSNISFLSPIGFRFTLANFPELNYFCQAANIPGVSLAGIDFPTPIKNIQFSGDEVSFEELAIRFVVDENLKNWLSIYDWIIGMGIPDKKSAEKYKKLKKGIYISTNPIKYIQHTYIPHIQQLTANKAEIENRRV